MYMTVKGNVVAFEWDSGNIDKNYSKHGITPKETEEVFVNEDAIVLPDIKHSKKEKRRVIVGKTFEKKYIFIVFTIRKERVRVISARKMHKEEVEKYEKIKKNPKL